MPCSPVPRSRFHRASAIPRLGLCSTLTCAVSRRCEQQMAASAGVVKFVLASRLVQQGQSEPGFGEQRLRLRGLDPARASQHGPGAALGQRAENRDRPSVSAQRIQNGASDAEDRGTVGREHRGVIDHSARFGQPQIAQPGQRELRVESMVLWSALQARRYEPPRTRPRAHVQQRLHYAPEFVDQVRLAL